MKRQDQELMSLPSSKCTDPTKAKGLWGDENILEFGRSTYCTILSLYLNKKITKLHNSQTKLRDD